MSVTTMQKCAPRWGQRTIFGMIEERAIERCSRNPFFARKNIDSIFAVQMMSAAAMQNYARRWGESTISECWLARASAPCSENLCFIRRIKDFLFPWKSVIQGQEVHPKPARRAKRPSCGTWTRKSPEIMLTKPCFLQGKSKISCFDILWYVFLLCKNVHGVEARALFSNKG